MKRIIAEIGRQLGNFEAYEPESRRGYIRMDLNENYLVPREIIAKILVEAAMEADTRSYAADEEKELYDTISDCLGISSDNLVVGKGGDGIINTLCQAFLRSGFKALTIAPSYPVFKWHTSRLGCDVIEVLLRPDFSLDPDSILRRVDKKTAMIFVPNPNNPTGNLFRRERILRIAREFEGLLVIDEAYYDFSRASLLHEAVAKESNILVIRTVSKLGFAGLRVGFAVGSEEIIRMVRKFVLPFDMPTVSLIAAIKVLRMRDALNKYVEELKRERGSLMRELSTIHGVEPYPSTTNFLLVHIKGKKAENVKRELASRGILVKDVSGLPLLDNHLRITVGTREMNNRLVNAMKEIMGG